MPQKQEHVSQALTYPECFMCIYEYICKHTNL